MGIDPSAFEAWTKAVYYVAATLGVAAAGLWTYRRYVIGREGSWNLQVGIDHSLYRVGAGQTLLVLRITLQNAGKILVRPGKKGCTVSLRSFPRTGHGMMATLSLCAGVEF